METIKVYVGTYGKYNNGDLSGDWLDLSDYSDKEEFIEACLELHKDEDDVELMFQDFDLPADWVKDFVNESDIDEKIFDILNATGNPLEWDKSDFLKHYNAMCSEQSIDDYIFDFDEDFFEENFSSKIGVARAISFGEVNWGDDYVIFNGYGNLETFSDPMKHIDTTEVIMWWIENHL